MVADFLVLAIPFAVLNELDISGAGFDALKHQAIDEQGRGHNGKLHLQFTRRDWLGTGPWPGVSNGSSYADTGYQAGWEATRAQSGNSGILVFYSGGSTTDAAVTNQAFANAGNGGVRTDAAIAQSQIAAVYPGLSWNGKATQSLPHKSPLFRASYSFYRVGQYTTFGGYEQVRQGGVLFCGEHTSIDFQGFMEGAASEGQRAGSSSRACSIDVRSIAPPQQENSSDWFDRHRRQQVSVGRGAHTRTDAVAVGVRPAGGDACRRWRRRSAQADLGIVAIRGPYLIPNP